TGDRHGQGGYRHSGAGQRDAGRGPRRRGGNGAGGHGAGDYRAGGSGGSPPRASTDERCIVTAITYREAVARGIAQEMRADPSVVFLGEDVASAGGVFKATVGLAEEFGPTRVRDTPISEQAILG